MVPPVWGSRLSISGVSASGKEVHMGKLTVVAVILAAALSLCALPSLGFAACNTYFVTLPDGKVLYCVDCGYGPVCT